MARCEVCFRHCEIEEGGLGFCGARNCKDGKVFASNYGRITGMALDPIEKKPLSRFFPGSLILSLGSYGCNLHCPFCQNSDISWSDEARRMAKRAEYITPEEVLETALRYQSVGNIGVAYTYNEPLVGYEFVRDCAKLVREAGMKNILVSNGTAELPVLEEILPYIDAMNIDLKGYSDAYYRDVLCGNRDQVMAFVTRAAENCHVELTTLIVPGENDSEEEMREISAWIADLPNGEDIPLHVSRFFPRFMMTDREATPVSKIYRLADVARERLTYVYTGNC